ncbi:MAG: c-type cytochrome [Candidatus Binatia bacterium]
MCSLAAAGALAATAEEPLGATRLRLKNPDLGRPKAIAEGRMLFVEAGCSKCHGSGARGGKGPDLTDDVWIIDGTDESLFRAISKGRPKRDLKGEQMPAWEEALEPDQVWKLIAWIRSIYRGDPKKRVW